jgi:hypothetical protein
MSRADLVEYLCAQQHAAYVEAAGMPPAPWVRVPTETRKRMRASVNVVLQELDALGMVRVPSERIPSR